MADGNKFVPPSDAEIIEQGWTPPSDAVLEKKNQVANDSTQPVSQRTEPSSASGIGYNWSGSDIGATQVKMPTPAEQLKAVVDPQVYRVEQTDKLKNKAIATQDSISKNYKELKDNVNAVEYAAEFPELKQLQALDAQLDALGQPTTKEQEQAYNALVNQRNELLDVDVSERNIFREAAPQLELKDPSDFDTASEYIEYEKGIKQQFDDFTAKKKKFETAQEKYSGKTKVRDIIDVANVATTKTGELGEKIKQEQAQADLAIKTAQELNKDKLEPLGFFGGFKEGVEQSTLANTVADMYITGNEEELSKALENIYTDAVVFPRENTTSGNIGEFLGGQAKPIALTSGATAINPALGVVAGSAYYGRMGVGSGLIDGYTTARQQGKSQTEALEIAKSQGKAGGVGGLVEGGAAALTFGGTGLTSLAKTPFKVAVTEALKDNAVDGVIAGITQVAQNKNLQRLGLDRETSEGVAENIAAEVLFGSAMNLGMYGGSRIKGYGTIINGLAKLPTAEIQMQVDNAVKQGTLDAARAEQFVNDIAQSKEAQEKLSAVEIPEQNEDNVIELQKELDQTEAQKKDASPAVLPAIEAQIADITNQIQEQLSVPLTDSEKGELNRLQTAQASNIPYDKRALSRLKNRQQQYVNFAAKKSKPSIVRNEENTTASEGENAIAEGGVILQDGTNSPNADQESSTNNSQVEAYATMDSGTTVPVRDMPSDTLPDGYDRVSGIKKSLIPEEKVGQADLERKTAQEVLDIGREQVDNGEVNARAFVEGIASGKGRALQPNEVAAMVYYKTQLDNQLDEANKKLIDAVNNEDLEAQADAQAEVDTLTGDLDNYYAMSEKTAYEQGLAFRLRQLLLDSEYSLAKQVNKYKGKNNGVIPPEVEARFAELSKKLQDVESRLRIAEEGRAAGEGQVAVQNIVDSVKNERNSTYTKRAKAIADNVRKLKTKPITFKDENGNDVSFIQNSVLNWNDIIETAAIAIEKTGNVADGVTEVINNLRGTDSYTNLSDTDKARLEQQIGDYFTISESPVFEMAEGRLKVPTSLVRDLVESGVTEIDALTKRIHDMVKQDLPDVTEREVRDAITGYGKTVGMNKDEVSVALREAKAQGRLISALEDAENSLRPLKSGQQRDKQSSKVKQLQKQVNEAMRKNGIEIERSQQSAEDKFQTALESFKTRTQTAIKDYERRLKEGDYVKEKRKPLDLDKEAQDLAEERERIKYEFDVEQEKNRLNNRPLSDKITEGIADALNIPKSILASADFSAPLRQGAILSAGNPTKVPKAMYDMFRATFSKDYSEKMMANIRASKEYPLMKKAGLFLAEPSAKMSASEEQFISRLAERIPVMGTVIKQTGKGYNGYLNSLRASVFAKGVDTMRDSGFTPEQDPQVFEAWAGFINNATGRGDLGGAEKNAAVLNAVLFSPRYLASRINLLNPVYYAKMPAPVRKEAAKNLVSYAIMLGISYGLANAAGLGLEFDPRSADFLKIRKGETRYDPAAGFSQVIRFIAQLTTAQRKRTDTGEITDLSKAKEGEDKTKYNNMENRWTVIDNFLRSKYNPSLGAARNLLEGQDMMGDDVTIMSEIKRNFVPLVAQGVPEKFEKDGIVGVLENVLPSMFGLGVQDYSIKEGKNKANEPSQKRPKRSRGLSK